MRTQSQTLEWRAGYSAAKAETAEYTRSLLEKLAAARVGIYDLLVDITDTGALPNSLQLRCEAIISEIEQERANGK
jgi:hypothetical protein